MAIDEVVAGTNKLSRAASTVFYANHCNHGQIILMGCNKIMDTFTFMQKVLAIIFTVLECL